jgi:hypothetical protein
VADQDDEKRGSAPSRAGRECGAAFSGDARYCLSCGARRGELPAAVAARIAGLLRRDREDGGEAGGDDAAPAAPPPSDPKPAAEQQSWMPSPRAAAAAVIGMLGLGVLLGSATSQIAQSAGVSSIILQVPSSAPAPPSEEEELAVEPEAEAATAPLLSEAPLPEEALPEEALPQEPKEEPKPLELPEEEGLPEVKHVFLIVLGENGYEETFGKTSTSQYLAKQLPTQGELVSNYYAVAQGELANRIAMVSGQGPTPETGLNCPNYTDVAPGTISLSGQVEGNGCVYPAEAKTLTGQLEEKGLEWKAYLEDSAAGAASGQPASCRHPLLGGPDNSAAPVPGDAYVTWRNPFVYFHSIVDGPECEKRDVDLSQLGSDLKAAKRTPALSYIVPDACHAGGETACEPGAPTGALAVESFLREVVPPILASPAYKEGGLVAITSAQAPQGGPHPDPSACCVVPAYPNLPAPAEAPASAPGSETVKTSGGGGKVGMLLISPFVEPGTVNETSYYNHYSLLLTIEELFELERLGYAGEIALSPFDGSVFNAAAEEELPQPAGRASVSRRGSAAR